MKFYDRFIKVRKREIVSVIKIIVKGDKAMPEVKGNMKKLHCFNTRSPHMRAALLAVLIISTFSLAAGCSPLWEPSDTEALGLVKSYFLYTRRGKAVDIEITARGKFIRECKCYPIEFQIREPEKEAYKKTFYFFKNQAGNVEVRAYMNEAKGQ